MAWLDMRVELTGEYPGLILHNGRLSNQLDPLVKAMKQITGKRMKTDEDHSQIAHLEYLGSLYLENGRVVIPDRLIEGTFVGGAKKIKRGPVAKAGFYVKGNSPLLYDGPSDPEELWGDGASPFVLSTMVVVQKNRVMRTRPYFPEWKLIATCCYDSEALNPETVLECFGHAGKSAGLGDWRPKYGRFTARVV